MSKYSKRVPNHHRTGLIGDDYPIDPYKRGEMTDDPYNRYWTEESMTLSARKSNPFVTSYPEHAKSDSYRGHHLSRGADWRGANMSSRITIENENLSGSNFSGVDLSGVTFFGCDLASVSFEEANVRNALFYECSLNNTYFDRTKGEGATFKDCDSISGTSFKRSNFERAYFENCHIYNCSFSDTGLIGAAFSNVILRDCIFDGATLHEAVFAGVTFASRDQLRGAKAEYMFGAHVRGDAETVTKFVEGGEKAINTFRRDSIERR